MATRCCLFRSRNRSKTYCSSSPRLDADSCPSLAESPVSYPPMKDYQVFLNFRGDQVRHGFVSHLSDAFERHEIKFFIDKDEPRGNDLKHLFVRIKESSIALAIFSTRYTESSWCMDELVKMKKLAVKNKLRVIPIFYKVKAKDVQDPTRDSEFGRNFWKLVGTPNNRDKRKEWIEALKCISGKTGLPLREERSESEFVYDIVNEVKKAIRDEEEKKPFWKKKLKRIVGNFVRLFNHPDEPTKSCFF